MKFLVTGVAGFMGSNICLRILNKGHEVIGLDNLSTGSKSNMLEFMYNPLFHFIIHDMTESFPAANVDFIIHCAFPDLKDPLHYLKTCSYGTFNVAGMARRNNAKLICITGDRIYGSNLASNVSEDVPYIINPTDAIGTGMQIMESILNNYKTLDIRILRVFNSYGPKMEKKSFIGSLMKSIMTKKKIDIPFNPKTPINFCFVDDIIDGVSCAMDLDKFGSPINLGSENNILLGDFVNLVIKESKSKCKVSYAPSLGAEDLGIIPNVDKAKKLLHWKQKIDYPKGIKIYIEYLKQGRNKYLD